MKCLSPIYTFFCMITAISGSTLHAQVNSDQKESEPPAKLVPIQQLIQDLVSKHFIVRQEAAKQLRSRMKESVPELLRAAAESKDPEIKEEAGKLAEQILWPTDEATAKQQLAKLADYAKKGQVDCLIETIIYWRDYADDDARVLIKEFGDRLLATTKGLTKRPIDVKSPPHAAIVRAKSLTNFPVFSLLLTESIECKYDCRDSSVVSSNIVFKNAKAHYSRLFVNGSLRPSHVTNSLIVCNGDLRLLFDGNKSPGNVTGSLIICFGNVEATHVDSSVIIATGNINAEQEKYEGSVIRANDAKLKKDFTVLNVSSLGVDFTLANKQIILTNVSDSGIVGRAGGKGNDVVLSVNNRPVTSLSEVSKAICRARAVGRGAFVLIRRGEQLVVLFLSETEVFH